MVSVYLDEHKVATHLQLKEKHDFHDINNQVLEESFLICRVHKLHISFDD